MAAFRAGAPAANLGYFRSTDWPTSGGSGPAMPSTITTAPGQNGGPGALSSWHPTVLWMLGFVVAELVAFHLLGRVLKI